MTLSADREPHYGGWCVRAPRTGASQGTAVHRPAISRPTLVVALAAFAAINALAWVVMVHVVSGAFGMAVPTLWLGTIAAITGLAVPVAIGAVGLRSPGHHG